MAEMYAVKKEDLEAIGDAIRLKRDITTPIEIKDMPLQIGLIDGGGNAKGFENVTDVMDISKNFGYMLSAFKNGNCKSGKKTWTEAFPNTEVLALETGLEEIHGIMLNLTDSKLSEILSGVAQCNKFIVIFVNDDGNLYSVGVSTNTNNSTGTQGAQTAFSKDQGVIYQSNPLNGSVRFDGGNMYCAGRYNRNPGFQIVAVNYEYNWIAW